jgi:putative transposase
VLQAAAGARTQHIADDLGIHWRTANRWRTRWEEASERLAAAEAKEDEKTLRRLIVEEILADASRPGSPPTFTAEQVCQIIAVACEDPEESERPVTHWTPRELRDEVIKRGIVESISVRSVGRFLKSGGVTTPSVSLLAEQQAG